MPELLAVNLPLPLPLLIAGAAVVMIAGGAVVAVIAGRGRGSTEDWAHAAYSIWTGGEDCGDWPQSQARSSLQSWYGVTSARGLWNVIEGLIDGTTGSPAWDQVRAVDLLRIGFAANYIDNDECQHSVLRIAESLTAQYDSWSELAAAFEQGMHAWQDQRGITDAAQRDRVQRNLPYLRNTAWRKVRFDATLEA